MEKNSEREFPVFSTVVLMDLFYNLIHIFVFFLFLSLRRTINPTNLMKS